jgi:hypothetical protein
MLCINDLLQLIRPKECSIWGFCFGFVLFKNSNYFHQMVLCNDSFISRFLLLFLPFYWIYFGLCYLTLFSRTQKSLNAYVVGRQGCPLTVFAEEGKSNNTEGM